MQLIATPIASSFKNDKLLFTEDLPPVGRSLVWAFVNGVTWTPEFHRNFTHKHSLEPFLNNRAAWRCGETNSPGRRPDEFYRVGSTAGRAVRSAPLSAGRSQSEERGFFRRVKLPAHLDAQPKAPLPPDGNASQDVSYEPIDGDVLYKILSRTIYEREGFEHWQNNAENLKQIVDDESERIGRGGKGRLKFDRRGIRAERLHVTVPEDRNPKVPDWAKGFRYVALDATGLEQTVPIQLVDCRFDGDIILDYARVSHLSLAGAELRAGGEPSTLEYGSASIRAATITIDGEFNLGRIHAGWIDLVRSKIAGALNMESATITGSGQRPRYYADPALLVEGAEIGGTVFLDHLTAKRGVSFMRSHLCGDFLCNKASFVSGGPTPALNCARAAIDGAVFLECTAEGQLAFELAVLGAMFVQSPRLQDKRREARTGERPNDKDLRPCLNLNQATIAKAIQFDEIDQESTGIIDLRDTRAPAFFIGDNALKAKCVRFDLYGFVYERIKALSSAKIRQSPAKPEVDVPGLKSSFTEASFPNVDLLIDWLSRDSVKPFRPQPWVHCAKVLQSMGHEIDALRVSDASGWRALGFSSQFCGGLVSVIIAAIVLLVSFVVPGWSIPAVLGIALIVRPLRNFTYFLLRSQFGWTTGFGQAHYRAFVLASLIIVGGAWLYQNAFETGVLIHDPNMRRTPPTLAAASSRSPAHGEEQDFQTLDSVYPAFNSFLYSLDTFLPIVDLRQADYWIPGDNVAAAEGDNQQSELAVLREWAVRTALLLKSESPFGSEENSPPPGVDTRFPKLTPTARLVWRYTWFEIIAGWYFTTVIIAGFTGLLDRKE